MVYGLVLMFDVTDYKTFKNLDLWHKDFSDNFEKNITIVLFGNKTDSPKEDWKVTDEEVK